MATPTPARIALGATLIGTAPKKARAPLPCDLSAPEHSLNFIAGAWVPSSTGATLPVHAPATGAALPPIPRSTSVDVDAAVAAAVAAFPSWAATPVATRAGLLDALADAIDAHAGELAVMESVDCGKTLAAATAVDIPRAAANFRFFAGAVRHDEGGRAFESEGIVNYTSRVPLGVVAAITPWNLALYLATWKIAPALACGNTVVLKPSEVTPRSAGALAALWASVGGPPGVLNVVHGLGGEAGASLVGHPDVRLVSFTGGTISGRAVAAAAAPMFKKLSLELGGKNAVVVFADTPMAEAVAAVARSGFTNNGQVCLSCSRVFVQRPLYDAFLPALGAAVGRLVVGDPADAGVDVGPLVSAAHRDKVAGYIAAGVAEGGVLLAGGPGAPPGLPPALAAGYYIRPTVFAGLDPGTSSVAREEVFGPVLTVHPFDTEAEAVALANDTKYGLCASVWTQNVGVAHRMSRALHVGMVWVNCWMVRDLRTPFGGVGDSGVGREGGQHSLDAYSEWRNTCVRIV